MVPQASTAAAAGPGFAGVWEVTLGLALVVGLIFVAAWAMRRVAPGASGSHSAIRIVAAMPVGPRERLVLVDAGGRQLLIGVTAQQISALHSFEEPPLPPSASPGPGGDFAARLREMLQPGART